MRGGVVTKSVGAAAVLAAIATIGSFLAPGSLLQWAVAAAVLRAVVMGGLGHDMAIHVGAWRLRWFAYLLAALEAAFVVLTVLGVPVEAHLGVAGAPPSTTPIGTLIGFIVWLLYGVVTLALGIACANAPRYRLFGILMIGAAAAWLLVMGVLVWPFIVAGALAALAYRLLRPSIAAATR